MFDASIIQASANHQQPSTDQWFFNGVFRRFGALPTITPVAKKTPEWHFLSLKSPWAKTDLKNLLDFSCPTCPVSVDGSSRFNCQSAACKNLHIHQAKFLFIASILMESQGTPSCLPPTRNKGVGLVSVGGYVQVARWTAMKFASQQTNNEQIQMLLYSAREVLLIDSKPIVMWFQVRHHVYILPSAMPHACAFCRSE